MTVLNQHAEHGAALRCDLGRANHYRCGMVLAQSLNSVCLDGCIVSLGCPQLWECCVDVCVKSVEGLWELCVGMIVLRF